MNNEALLVWARSCPNSPGHQAVIRVLAESAAKDATIKAQAERIAAQSDALSRVAERGAQSDPPVQTDFSRPPSLTPPAVVQMPGQMGAPDGLPMGDPAPESLIEEDLRIRQQEVTAHN